ncbi:uncharacterized protein B0I36DRAFT_349238 [Microdochium trichocladiopsis]|uniref:Uncharacterized protein n=1 Tax=Microdochium trichocladiopsis TaxID=1682393 RepID=A0A9P9BNC2_9PEZI|nr:uncharacterized protein B0I36DRAFT_349238 [Microdochium trichocladiopsis]KAH7031111.1 hypothetical protein B0I36DRAFT_349238 [Microdochium trichocladiopsis]
MRGRLPCAVACGSVAEAPAMAWCWGKLRAGEQGQLDMRPPTIKIVEDPSSLPFAYHISDLGVCYGHLPPTELLDIEYPKPPQMTPEQQMHGHNRVYQYSVCPGSETGETGTALNPATLVPPSIPSARALTRPGSALAAAQRPDFSSSSGPTHPIRNSAVIAASRPVGHRSSPRRYLRLARPGTPRDKMPQQTLYSRPLLHPARAPELDVH